jgi:hypothetical protein
MTVIGRKLSAVSGNATQSERRLGNVTLRFESELTAQELEIWRLWGVIEGVRPVGNNSTGECAGREIIDELTGFLVRAVALRGLGSPPAPAEVSVAPAKS